MAASTHSKAFSKALSWNFPFSFLRWMSRRRGREREGERERPRSPLEDAMDVEPSLVEVLG
jgi:hypothetical protein